MQSQKSVRPIFGLLLGILATSTAAIFIRYAQGYAPSLIIASYRLGIAGLILIPLVLYRRWPEVRSLNRRDLNLALLSGIFLAFHFATWITSLEYTTVASSVVLVSSTPLWVALLTPITLKEPLARSVWFGMVIAFVGATTIGLSDTCSWGITGLVCPQMDEFVRGRAFYGDILALAGAIMAASYMLIGRGLRSKMSLLSYIAVVYGVAAFILVLITIGTHLINAGSQTMPVKDIGASLSALFFDYPPRAFLWFALLALVPQLVGHSLFNWALRFLSAAYVSISLLGEPIGSSILAFFLLGEAPTAFKIIGAILILMGILIAAQSESKS